MASCLLSSVGFLVTIRSEQFLAGMMDLMSHLESGNGKPR